MGTALAPTYTPDCASKMVAKASGGGSSSLASTGDGTAREPIRARIAAASAVLPRSSSVSANASTMESAAPSVNPRVGSVTRYNGRRTAVGASLQAARTRAIAAIEVQCAMAILLSGRGGGYRHPPEVVTIVTGTPGNPGGEARPFDSRKVVQVRYSESGGTSPKPGPMIRSGSPPEDRTGDPAVSHRWPVQTPRTRSPPPNAVVPTIQILFRRSSSARMPLMPPGADSVGSRRQVSPSSDDLIKNTESGVAARRPCVQIRYRTVSFAKTWMPAGAP